MPSLVVARRPAQGALATAIAIGSFDGVHRGHAALLERVRREAREHGLTAAALTFEPLPREFFAPASAPPRLTTLRERACAIGSLGIEVLFAQRFDAAFAALSPEAFARRLREEFGARRVLVGEDFRYGAGRRGDVASLAAAGRSLGFEVVVLAPSRSPSASSAARMPSRGASCTAPRGDARSDSRPPTCASGAPGRR